MQRNQSAKRLFGFSANKLSFLLSLGQKFLQKFLNLDRVFLTNMEFRQLPLRGDRKAASRWHQSTLDRLPVTGDGQYFKIKKQKNGK